MRYHAQLVTILLAMTLLGGGPAEASPEKQINMSSSDGNMVIYRSGAPAWASNTAGA